MTVAAPARPAPRPVVAPLPPLGPAWYPAAMGTGILATLLQTHAARIPGAAALAPVVLALAWAVLALLTLGFGLRVVRSRRAFTDTVRDVTVAPMWGTVSMGLLAVGSATATVLPAVAPTLGGLAWRLDWLLWTAGTAVGVTAAVGFAIRLCGRDAGTPTTVWGLAVVGPMVSATTGSALVPHAAPGCRAWLAVGTAACFVLSLALGSVIFARAYHQHWRVAPLPLAASASAWIPLGMVGQSTAAAQAMAGRARPALHPATAQAVQAMANAYGWVMLAVGAPLVAWAAAVTLRGFRGRMPFVPGWWALTFPVGTLALGATLLGAGTGLRWLAALGALGTLALCGTVSLCLAASVRALRSRGWTPVAGRVTHG